MNCRGTLAAVATGLALLLAAGPVTASQVRQVSLPEMVGAAGTIFTGQVESSRFDQIEGVPVTRVTFRVEDAVRGTAAETVTLTFLGGERPGGLPYRLPGMPRFGAGERFVLLTYPTSSLGLTAPVGLYQGCFQVEESAAGLSRVVAVGPRRRLLAGVTGPLPRGAGAPDAAAAPSFVYSDFMRLLRHLAATTDPPPATAAPEAAPAPGGGQP